MNDPTWNKSFNEFRKKVYTDPEDIDDYLDSTSESSEKKIENLDDLADAEVEEEPIEIN